MPLVIEAKLIVKIENTEKFREKSKFKGTPTLHEVLVLRVFPILSNALLQGGPKHANSDSTQGLHALAARLRGVRKSNHI